jgi:hypothetical protein
VIFHRAVGGGTERRTTRLDATAIALAVLVLGCGEVKQTPSPPDGPVAVEGSLIDDLEDGDRNIAAVEGRIGYWYTVNDGTGSQTPPPRTFAATSGGAGASAYCVATQGSGFTAWGAKLGVFLHHVGDPHPGLYDASGYAGIRFHARGNSVVRAAVLTSAVRGDTLGGTCDESAGGCFDYHGLAFALTPDWREYTMSFDDMAQEGWGKVIAFDPAAAMAIDFSVAKQLAFDFAIDDLQFY